MHQVQRKNDSLRRKSEKGHYDKVLAQLTEDQVDPAAYDNEAFCEESRSGNLNVVKFLLNDVRVDPTTLKNYVMI